MLFVVVAYLTITNVRHIVIFYVEYEEDAEGVEDEEEEEEEEEVKFSSVQDGICALSGRPICASPRLSGVSAMLPLK